MARLAGLPWSRRLRDALIWIVLIGAIPAVCAIRWALAPVNDGRNQWIAARITGFSPTEGPYDGQGDQEVLVNVRFPSGRKESFRVDAADASRCHIGQEVRLRVFARNRGGDGLWLPPAPCG